MSYGDAFIGFCAGVVVTFGFCCYIADWFAKGLDYEDLEDEE